MTDTNVAATKPSLLRAWWMNKNLRFNVAMSSIIMILNIEVSYYMRTHKIPIVMHTEDSSLNWSVFVIFYIVCGLYSCMAWVFAITDVTYCGVAYGFGLMSHVSGLGVCLRLLDYISPQLALFARVNCGLFYLWFVAAMIGPCLRTGWSASSRRLVESTREGYPIKSSN